MPDQSEQSGQSGQPLLLTLFFRPGCHLCEDMLFDLEPLLREFTNVTLDRKDIEQHDDLLARFDDKVPVLAHGEQVLCEYFLDEALLREYLNGQAGPP